MYNTRNVASVADTDGNSNINSNVATNRGTDLPSIRVNARTASKADIAFCDTSGGVHVHIKHHNRNHHSSPGVAGAREEENDHDDSTSSRVNTATTVGVAFGSGGVLSRNKHSNRHTSNTGIYRTSEEEKNDDDDDDDDDNVDDDDDDDNNNSPSISVNSANKAGVAFGSGGVQSRNKHGNHIHVSNGMNKASVSVGIPSGVVAMKKHHTRTMPCSYSKMKKMKNQHGTLGGSDYIEKLLLTSLPLTLIIHILNDVGAQEDGLLNVSGVSKLLNSICRLPEIESFIPTYELSPPPNNSDVISVIPGVRLARKLTYNQNNNNLKFIRYGRVRLNNLNTYASIDLKRDFFGSTIFNHIVSLDMSLPSPEKVFAVKSGQVDSTIMLVITTMMPKVQVIDLSGVEVCQLGNRYNNGGIHSICPNIFRIFDKTSLKKVTWNYSTNRSLSGHELKNAENLKEIISDDTIFNRFWLRQMTEIDLETEVDTKFIFYQCCNSLERLSIRGAKIKGNVDNNSEIKNLPQNTLIKFIRNAPQSLKWFRSDLTKENMCMLLLERPTIQLSN